MISGVSRAALLAAGACFACAALAADWTLDRLMQELAAVKSAKGRFVERRTLGILNEPLESSGTLLYVAPDRLEKRTLAPRPESMVLQGDQLTIESSQPKRRRTIRLDDYPAVGVFVESIRSTHAGDLAALKRHYDVGLDGDERQWRMVLKPSDPKMQELVSEIRIGGSGGSIRSVEILEPGGDRSAMTITRDGQ